MSLRFPPFFGGHSLTRGAQVHRPHQAVGVDVERLRRSHRPRAAHAGPAEHATPASRDCRASPSPSSHLDLLSPELASTRPQRLGSPPSPTSAACLDRFRSEQRLTSDVRLRLEPTRSASSPVVLVRIWKPLDAPHAPRARFAYASSAHAVARVWERHVAATTSAAPRAAEPPPLPCERTQRPTPAALVVPDRAPASARTSRRRTPAPSASLASSSYTMLSK